MLPWSDRKSLLDWFPLGSADHSEPQRARGAEARLEGGLDFGRWVHGPQANRVRSEGARSLGRGWAIASALGFCSGRRAPDRAGAQTAYKIEAKDELKIEVFEKPELTRTTVPSGPTAR